MDSRQYPSQASNHIAAPLPAPAPAPVPAQSSTKKRRTSASGGRGVAHLTPEQLAKKRANDREAQRAIRERTKGQIEQLERKIQELTTQKPYQELQNAIRQKELVEAENEEIKKRLASVLSIIQPICSASGSGLLGPVHNRAQESARQTPVFSPASVNSQPAPPIVALAASYSDNPPIRSAAPASSTYAPSPRALRKTPPSIAQAGYTSQPAGFSPVNATDQRQGNTLPSRSSGEKLDLSYLLQSRHDNGDKGRHNVARERPPSGSTPSYLPMHTLSPFPDGHELSSTSMPAHAISPKNIRPTCPLDGLLLDFLADRRQRAIEGVSTQELIGPLYPSFLSLLDPQRSHYSHPLSKVFTDMMSTFPDISTLPEQVAILYIMFLIMRWQICPSQETYDRLPDWVTPRPSQLFSAHPAWIDHLPWPRMRDKLVTLYPSIPFDEFFIPYTTTISVNWPYEPREVLQSMPDTDELAMSTAFERHMRDLGNWTLGPAFANAHPSLTDTFKIKPGTERGRNS